MLITHTLHYYTSLHVLILLLLTFTNISLKSNKNSMLNEVSQIIAVNMSNFNQLNPHVFVIYFCQSFNHYYNYCWYKKCNIF